MIKHIIKVGAYKTLYTIIPSFLFRHIENKQFQIFDKYEIDDFTVTVSSKDEYNITKIDSYRKEIIKFQSELQAYYSTLSRPRYYGFCEVCEKRVLFFVNKSLTDKRSKNSINWRETLRCPLCGLNNRDRMTMKAITKYFSGSDYLYINERMTDFYRVFSRNQKNVISSEFVGQGCKGGEIYIVRGSSVLRQKKVRHEDILNLSFDTESLDGIIHRDVLEHVYDYNLALKEIFRCLRKGGRTLFTVPFGFNC